MTELLDQALHAIQHDARSAVRPVAQVEARVRRRRARRRLAVSAMGAIIAAAATVGVVSAGHDGASGTETSRGLERVLLTNQVLVPTALPRGLRFDSLTAQGSAIPTVDSPFRQIALADAGDPNRFIRAEAVVGGDDGADWPSVTSQLLQTTVAGARGAAYGMTDTGVVSMEWLKDGHRFDLTSYGVTLYDLLSWASGLTFASDGSLEDTATPGGLAVIYEGVKMSEGPRIEQAWRTTATDGPWLDIRVLGNAPWSAPSLRLGRGDPIKLGAANGLYYEAPTQRTIAWLDSVGTQHEVASNGLSRAELVGVVQGLTPLDATRWRRLRTSVAPDRISNLLDPVFGQSGEPNATPATTAGAVPRQPAGFRDTAVRASNVPVGHDVAVDGLGVVHTADDRWVAVSTYIDAGGGSDGCQIEPERSPERTVLAWNAPCTGGRYAPDGACVNERCVVGLRTIDVRVVDDRVEIDPDRFHVGTPRQTSTG